MNTLHALRVPTGLGCGREGAAAIEPELAPQPGVPSVYVDPETEKAYLDDPGQSHGASQGRVVSGYRAVPALEA